MTLAKGLAVLGAFGRQRPTMTLSQAARSPICRAPPRGACCAPSPCSAIVEQQGRTFSLSPQILDLGFAYLSTQSWIDRALPLMRELSERLGESCSAAILQGNDIVYVARVPARRIMSASLSVGSRLPAFHTALGRDAVRLSRRGRDLAPAEVAAHRSLHAVDHHRSAGAVRSHPRRPRAGLLHRRRRARARLARARRAGHRPRRPGHRRHQSVDALDAHHAQRDARALPAGAQPHGRAGRLRRRSDRELLALVNGAAQP